MRTKGAKNANSRRRVAARLLVILLGSVLAMPVSARETLTITASTSQPRAVDAILSQGAPTTNVTVGANLTVMSRNNRAERSIVEFDFSSVPNGGIKSAVMSLQVASTTAAGRTYGAFPTSTYFHQPDVTWDNRVANINWGAQGGDIPGTATATATVPATGAMQFTITSDVQNWYNGTPNYGELIKDSNETNGGGAATNFNSIEGGGANAPQIALTFVQNVRNLSATAGNASVTLNWTFPTPIGTVMSGEPYAGVVILRRANLPVDKGSNPTDTVDPLSGHAAGSCVTVGNGQVVFDDSSGATSFTDNSSDPCGAPANGTAYFYKVFCRDAKNYYSSQPVANGSTFTEEIAAMPNTTAATQEQTSWINATFSTDLASPSLFPNNVIVVGSGTNLLFGLDPAFGLRKYLPVSLGGPVDSRSPIIDAGDSTLSENVIYVADNDGLVYAVATDTGQIVWVVNPTGATASTNNFTGSASVALKSINPSLTHDIVILGTDNGATTSGNEIVGLDGNTGASGTTSSWTPIVGNTGGVAAMDIITSSPLVDYVNNAVWVTSHSNCGVAQPSLWKLKMASPGGVLLTENLGDMDVSPALTFSSDVLFVANGGYTLAGGVCTAGNSTLYAINPTTGGTLASFAPSPTDGAITGFPLVLGFQSPYTIVFSAANHVHIVQYNKSTSTFTAVATIAVASPSAPIGDSNLTKVYVGSSDGFIHEIDLTTNTDDFDMYVNTVNTGSPAIIGEVSLDLSLSRVYIATTDQRSYGFAFPF
jgi:PQQ-like domain